MNLLSSSIQPPPKPKYVRRTTAAAPCLRRLVVRGSSGGRVGGQRVSLVLFYLWKLKLRRSSHTFGFYSSHQTTRHCGQTNRRNNKPPTLQSTMQQQQNRWVLWFFLVWCFGVPSVLVFFVAIMNMCSHTFGFYSSHTFGFYSSHQTTRHCGQTNRRNNKPPTLQSTMQQQQNRWVLWFFLVWCFGVPSVLVFFVAIMNVCSHIFGFYFSQQTSGHTNCRNNKPPTLSQQCNSTKQGEFLWFSPVLVFHPFSVFRRYHACVLSHIWFLFQPTDIRSRGSVVRRIAANKKPLILSQQHCDFPNIGVLVFRFSVFGAIMQQSTPFSLFSREGQHLTCR